MTVTAAKSNDGSKLDNNLSISIGYNNCLKIVSAELKKIDKNILKYEKCNDRETTEFYEGQADVLDSVYKMIENDRNKYLEKVRINMGKLYDREVRKFSGQINKRSSDRPI